MLKKCRVLCRDRAVNLQALISPVPDPVAVVEIGVAGVAVTHKCFVMAPAGTDRPGPAGVAIVLCANVPAVQEILLLCPVDAGCDVPQGVLVGIDKTMAGCDIA